MDSLCPRWLPADWTLGPLSHSRGITGLGEAFVEAAGQRY